MASASSVATAAISFTYGGSSEAVSRAFNRLVKSQFEEDLLQILRRTQYMGVFNIMIPKMVPGNSHKKGVWLGHPVEARRCIEIYVQYKSNNERFLLLLSVPRGVDVMDFHKSIENAMEAIHTEAAERVPTKRGNGTSDSKVVAISSRQTQPTKFTIEAYMEVLCKNAPTLGLISRENGIDALAQLGGDAEKVFSDLAAQGHLVALDGSEEMFRVGDTWLERFGKAATPAPAASTTPAPQAPAKAPVGAKPLDALAQLECLTSSVRQGQAVRANLEVILKEIVELELLIEEKMLRIDTLRVQKTEAEALLNGPELKKAEERLAAIQQLLNPV